MKSPSSGTLRHTIGQRDGLAPHVFATALAAAIAFVAPPLPAAHATTIAVDTTNDEDNSDRDCSLREAIIAANQDSARSGCPAGNGADRITLPAGTYTLTIAGTGEFEALTGDLNIRSDLTLVGAGRANTVIDGNGIDTVLNTGNSTVTISRLTIANGNGGAGGGVRVGLGEVTIVDSRIRDNVAFSGGGIHSDGGKVTLLRTRVDGNTAETGGGIVTTGGAARLYIFDSVISGNVATTGNAGGIFNSTIASLSNSTVTQNVAADHGGGILSVASAESEVVLFNVTIASNAADSDNDDVGDGGGIYAPPGGRFNARNTIIGHNVDRSGVVGGTMHPDCSGLLVGVGYNLIENVTGCSLGGSTMGYVTGADPELGPLQGNGGGTLTRELYSSSPAIDAGNPSGCIGPNGIDLDTDQRGFARNGRCDIGAFEYDSPGTPTPTNTAAHTKTHTPTQTRRATATPTRPPTRTVTATRTATTTASATHTFDPDPPPTEAATRTPTIPRTPTATDATTTATATRSASATHTFNPDASPTLPTPPSPSATAVASPTLDSIGTATLTAAIATPTVTPPASASPSPTATTAAEPKASATNTPIGSAAISATMTAFIAPSVTPSATTAEPATPSATPATDATQTPTATPIPTAAAGDCPGDCDGNQRVGVDELLRGVNIALHELSLAACPAFDANRNAAIQVDEIIAGVSAALYGCGAR